MNRLGAFLFVLLALLGSGSALAQDRMAVALVAETQSVLPGDSVTLAFVMRPRAGLARLLA
jgi:hypothetical protein